MAVFAVAVGISSCKEDEVDEEKREAVEDVDEQKKPESNENDKEDGKGETGDDEKDEEQGEKEPEPVQPLMVLESVSVSGSEGVHGYVDLGLPSGTLWATCNIGAEKAEGEGETFRWNKIPECFSVYSITVLYDRSVETEFRKNRYDSDGNACSDNDSYTPSPLFVKKETQGEFIIGRREETYKSSYEIADEYDWTVAEWGDEWQMPSLEQVAELFRCEKKGAILNGVEGVVFIGSNGNSLFLPSEGSDANGYWTSSFKEGTYIVGHIPCYSYAKAYSFSVSTIEDDNDGLFPDYCKCDVGYGYIYQTEVKYEKRFVNDTHPLACYRCDWCQDDLTRRIRPVLKR